MAGSAADIQALAFQSWKDAFDRREEDLQAAQSREQAQAVMANISRLDAAWLQAANAALDASRPGIEDAFNQAAAAKQAVDEAYADAKSLAERIGKVGDLAGKVGDLVDKARAAAG